MLFLEVSESGTYYAPPAEGSIRTLPTFVCTSAHPPRINTSRIRDSTMPVCVVYVARCTTSASFDTWIAGEIWGRATVKGVTCLDFADTKSTQEEKRKE